MQRKRIKFWIIFGCIFISIPILCIVLNFSMKLKTVDVEFRARPAENSMLSDDITTSIKQYFSLNKNIVFLNTDPIIEEIEQTYPFVKINQTIKSFPNILRVYISERIPKYRVIDSKNNDQYLILDEDFKVIATSPSSELFTDGTYGDINYGKITTEINKDNLSISTTVGKFITNKLEIKNNLNRILSGVYGATKDYSVARLIKIKESKDGISFNINMKNISEPDQIGCNIVIDGTDDLIMKTFAGVSTFESEVRYTPEFNTLTTFIRISVVTGEYRGIKYTAS